MNKYKYLLSVEGNDVATGLKWMLYSNSVVFMSRPTVASWAMEDLLVPFVHYIPLANDYSNLLEMVKWANEHDEACQEISKRATEFIEHLWMSEQAQKDTEYLQKALVTTYVNQFDDALSSCAKDQSIEDTLRSRPNANETQVTEPATKTSSFEKMHKQLHKFAASPNYNVEKKKYEIGVSMNRGTGGLLDTDRTLLADIYSSVDSVFEFGLGESSKIAAWVGVPRYVGVDSDASWVTNVRKEVKKDHFRFIFADIGETGAYGNPKNEELQKIPLSYQSAPLNDEMEAFDFYLIDGRYRVACACASMLHALSHGGDMKKVMFGVHDYGRQHYHQLEKVADIVKKSERLRVFQLKPSTTEQEIFQMWEKNMWEKGR